MFNFKRGSFFFGLFAAVVMATLIGIFVLLLIQTTRPAPAAMDAPTATHTGTSTATPTQTPTPTYTETPAAKLTDTVTATPAEPPTATPTATSTATPTDGPTTRPSDGPTPSAAARVISSQAQGAPIAGPLDVAVDNQNNVYVVNGRGDGPRIVKLDQNGTPDDAWNEALSQGLEGLGVEPGDLTQVAVDDQGRIYIAGTSAVLVMDDGSPQSLQPIDEVVAAAIDAPAVVARTEGKTSVKPDQGRVFYYLLPEPAPLLVYSGTESIPIGDPLSFEVATPPALAVDLHGDAFVAGSDPDLPILKLNERGEFDEEWSAFLMETAADATGSALNQPRGLAVDRQANVYIADTGNNRILVVSSLDQEPEILLDWTGDQDALGELGNPLAVTVNSGGVAYIADTNNDRIVAFKPAQLMAANEPPFAYDGFPTVVPTPIAVPFSGAATGQGVNVKRVSLAGQPASTLQVQPGGAVDIVMDYDVWSTLDPGPEGPKPGECQVACIVNLTVGLVDPTTGTYHPLACIYNGLPGREPGQSQTWSSSLTVPTTPGEYSLRLDYHLDYNCRQAQTETEQNPSRESISLASFTVAEALTAPPTETATAPPTETATAPPTETVTAPPTETLSEVTVEPLRTASPLQNPDNGSAYELVTSPASWDQARINAERLSFQGCAGHLATITSESEDSFIRSNFSGRFWLGGFQDPADTIEVDRNWKWVTVEPWVYTGWRGGEPNDYYFERPGSEQVLEMNLNVTGNQGWNDDARTAGQAYLVEYEGEDCGGAPTEELTGTPSASAVDLPTATPTARG